MAEIQGFCDRKFAPVCDVLAKSIDQGQDLGASFAITIEGEMVVDIWGGHLDEHKTQPWFQDTIVNVYSSTKTMSFLCALVLADRGQLDFDANVAQYWPEFAQSGKDQVKVWHVMNHAAGLSGLDVPMAGEDNYDWDKIVNALAAQAPWWEPGTATGYHAMTQGYLIGELVRRITGKRLGIFFQDEIAGPLKADFFIGLPVEEFGRTARLVVPEQGNDLASGLGEAAEDSIAKRTFASPFVKATDSFTDAWRQAEIPAANGHGNARAVARLQAPLACKGSAFGVDLMSKQTAESVMRKRISGQDLVLGVPLAFGLGFGLNSELMPLSPNKNVCFWGGWGGSSVLVDQDAALSASFAMNRMFPGLLGDRRSYTLVQTMYQCLQ